MRVTLTRKQIEDSPAIDTHKPISRQYEEEYHRYYGWPYYWEGDGLWGGMRGFPVLEVPRDFTSAQPAEADCKHKCADSSLRSTLGVAGYHLQATDGIIGYIFDFLMDDQNWTITQLVIKTGHRFTGKEVLIPVSEVQRISYEESTVFVRSTKDAVEKSPEYRLLPAIAPRPEQPIPIL